MIIIYFSALALFDTLGTFTRQVSQHEGSAEVSSLIHQGTLRDMYVLVLP